MTADYRKRMVRKAHDAVAFEIEKGRLAKPSALICVDCGNNAVHYDHRDYSRPLDVVPVCRRCNSKRGPAWPFVHKGEPTNHLFGQPLSRMQMKILSAMQSGFCATEIAALFGISVKTVSTHIKKATDRFGLPNSTALKRHLHTNSFFQTAVNAYSIGAIPESGAFAPGQFVSLEVYERIARGRYTHRSPDSLAYPELRA